MQTGPHRNLVLIFLTSHEGRIALVQLHKEITRVDFSGLDLTELEAWSSTLEEVLD